MKWNPLEQQELDRIISNSEESCDHRSASFPHSKICITVSDAESLKAELADQTGGALLVRHLLRVLNFDEQRLFALRVEHKLVQAHVLERYCPGVIPVTIGARRELSGLTLTEIEDRVRDAYEQGFLIKSSLGDGSGDTSSVDKRPVMMSRYIEELPRADSCSLSDEEFIFQKRISIAHEYRVHSIEDTVIRGLTYMRYSPGATSSALAQKLNLFVQQILDNLPGSITRDSLYGWDIAIDNLGNPVVIEVNSTGLHPIYRQGFQCSGFFQNPATSIPSLAKLLLAVTRIYGVDIEIEMPSYPQDHFAQTYWLVRAYQSFERSIAYVRSQVAATTQSDQCPDGIDRKLSLEDNTVLWMCSQTQGIEDALRVCDSSIRGPEDKPLHPELMELRLPIANGTDDCSPVTLTMRCEDQSFFHRMLEDMDVPTTPFESLGFMTQNGEIKDTSIELEPTLTLRLGEIAHTLGVELAAILHLAVAQALARITGHEDVVFGTAMYGTFREDVDHRAGMFRNILPIRILIDAASVESCVVRVHRILVDLRHHERASLSLAHRSSPLSAPTPLFTTLLDCWTNRIADQTTELPQTCNPLYHGEKTSFPLTILVAYKAQGIQLTVRAQPPLDPGRVCNFVSTSITSLIEALELRPFTSVSHLDILPSSERHQVLYAYNNKRTGFIPDKCVHERFEAQVKRSPDATAVIFEDGPMSYAELNLRANRLANYLRHLGVKPDVPIALCFERGFNLIIAMLAVLKAGGAYVPLDPAYPGGRLRFMLDDSQPLALLTQKGIQNRFLGLQKAPLLICLDSEDVPWKNLPGTDLASDAVGLKPNHLAYIIYTSGSTGTPKGVMVQHSSIVHLFDATDPWFRFGQDDVWTLFHSYAFDFSVWEIWGALFHGGKLVIVPKVIAQSPLDFYKMICRERVTILNQTPSAFRHFVAAQASISMSHELRYVICGGDTFDITTLIPWFEENRQEHTQLVNMYGITESTVHVSFRLLEQMDIQPRSGSAIGCPIPDLKVYILDPRGEPVPLGVAGEMYIGGAGLARGYLNRPQLTAERFLADPFSSETGARMYRSGDIGRWCADGNMEFLGRSDYQVKIRGFRVELGEIEACLMRHPAVREAVVVARQDTTEDTRLVAYCTSTTEGGLPDVVQLRSHLSASLPEYMIPSAYILLTALPLTPNGKLDRNALPAPEQRRNKGTIELVLTATEGVLLGIWRDLFRNPDIQVEDTFISLGGHSLLAVKLINRVRSHFTFEISLEFLLSQDPCIRDLAALIDSEEI